MLHFDTVMECRAAIQKLSDSAWKMHTDRSLSKQARSIHLKHWNAYQDALLVLHNLISDECVHQRDNWKIAD